MGWLACKHMASGDFNNTPLPDLLDFGDMGPCKVAVQLRCSVFQKNRGIVPPASPIIAFQAASSVVARWLVEFPLRLPTLVECQEVSQQLREPVPARRCAQSMASHIEHAASGAMRE